MNIFIEFWKAKDAWYQLCKEERTKYVGEVIEANKKLPNDIIVYAWGTNDDTSNYKAAYDFYSVTKFPDQQSIDDFEKLIEKAGWYNYFEQINMSGKNIGTEAVLQKMVDLPSSEKLVIETKQ